MEIERLSGQLPALAGILALLLFVLASTEAKAGDLAPPDTLDGWTVQWIAALNGTQAAYSNWSKGGVNSLSAVGSSRLTSHYRSGEFSYSMQLHTRYGESRLQDEGVRKTDDRISLRNRFLYDLGDEAVDFSVYSNINFESQFGRGFRYGEGPEGEDILISDFLAPAYMTQNVGVAYIPTEAFSVEAGLGLKQTFVRDTALSKRYGLDPGERFFNEAGFTFGINVDTEIMENVRYTGYLETFTNLNRPLRRTDLLISNQLVGRINNYLQMTLQFEMIYDDDFSERLQVSQVLSAGLTVNLVSR